MTTELAESQSANSGQQLQHKERIGSQSWNPSASSQKPAEQQTEQNMSTVASLADPNVKFPLENAWSFWFYKNEKTKPWKENVKLITTVDFVEDFWGVYNHLQIVSKINIGCDYMFFKKDIPPMWEDTQNRDGGRWVLNVEKKFHSTLDHYWLNALLALIGDQFMEESPLVNGVWVNVRARADKISLWTKNASNAEAQMKIGRKFREILHLKDNVLTYEEHDESNKKADPSSLYKC